jgi:hypothetical protein
LGLSNRTESHGVIEVGRSWKEAHPGDICGPVTLRYLSVKPAEVEKGQICESQVNRKRHG